MSEKITIGELYRDLASFIKTSGERHDLLLAQTTKTNGKVADLCSWRERMKGVWVTFCIFGGILSFGIPIVMNYYYSQKNIEKIIEEKMSAYLEDLK